MTIGRAAVLTRAHKGRAACHYCGICHRGCITQSYFSSLNSTLPAAEKTGRLTLRPYSVVRNLNYDSKTGRVTSVNVIDAQTKNELEFKARIFFICCSTLESTRLLLNSATPEMPNGLANSSGELGHNLMDHHMGAGASGSMPGHEDKMPFGNRPNGIYIPRFRNVKSKQRDFIRGYGYQGGGSRDGWTRGMSMPGFGAEFKNALKKPGPWRMGMGGFGECLPNHNNYVEINKRQTRCLGHSYADDPLRMGRKRTDDVEGHRRPGRRDAGRLRREEHFRLSGNVQPRSRNSRNGNGTHGPRSEDFRPERAQSSA